MLTWSDWFSEPRSNRYHYAVRFAETAPVLFVQPTLPAAAGVQVRASGHPALDIVLLPEQPGEAEAEALWRLARERGMRRPLLWIYSSRHYAAVLARFPQCMRVWHATEDYLTPQPGWQEDHRALAASVRELLAHIDVLVAVSERVLQVYVEEAGYRGEMLLANNGCDAAFFEQRVLHAPPPRTKTCIFQGGINSRLDYRLLEDTINGLPDWQFWFCGRADDRIEGWRRVRSLPNVAYLGELDPEALAARMLESTVGIIPFVNAAYIRNSRPLKAYEYVACGLPVVSIPIDALREDPGLFHLAGEPAAFIAAIEAAAATRSDPEALARRRSAAARESWDVRFSDVRADLARARSQLHSAAKRLNVLVLRRRPAGGSSDAALTALADRSRHDFFEVAGEGGEHLLLDHGCFDAVVAAGEISPALAEAMSCFAGALVCWGSETPPRWSDLALPGTDLAVEEFDRLLEQLVPHGQRHRFLSAPIASIDGHGRSRPAWHLHRRVPLVRAGVEPSALAAWGAQRRLQWQRIATLADAQDQSFLTDRRTLAEWWASAASLGITAVRTAFRATARARVESLSDPARQGAVVRAFLAAWRLLPEAWRKRVKARVLSRG